MNAKNMTTNKLLSKIIVPVRNFLLKYTLRKTFHMSELQERTNTLCGMKKH